MKKPVAAIVMAGLITHAFAGTPANPPLGQQAAPTAEQAAPNRQKDAARLPGASAASAAEGNLTPVYVGATVAGAAVIVGALTGGGHDGSSGTGGTTGTTGTH